MTDSELSLDLPETLIWSAGKLSVLDQRLLPQTVRYLELDDLQDAWTAIQTLAVRGAPAIGVTAGYALVRSMSRSKLKGEAFAAELQRNGDYLKSARPTAVNLAWAVDRLIAAYTASGDPAVLADTAIQIHQQDVAICRAIGEQGAPLIQPDSGVLTHCNAGSLATSRFGTATAPMYMSHARGTRFKVFADETRPLYQGARLTAWELEQAGIDVTLICDNMAASMMAAGHIQLALVGTDRVTANGDVINKIGTLNVAILCQHFNIPFYVACPSSTFDPATASGQQVVIEQRASAEVTGTHSSASQIANPAFDVTPHALVTGIITEHGICRPTDLAETIRKHQA